MNNNPLAIFCCFLPLNNDNKNLWNKINFLLKEKNIDFLFLTSSEGYDNLEFPVINIPFSLKGFDENFYFLKNNQLLSEKEVYLVERDINWNNDSVDEYFKYYNGYKKCKNFYQSLVNKLNPNIVFVWGHYLPQSIIFKQVLEEHNIPVFCLERGFYSGSLMIENLLYDETDNPVFFNNEIVVNESYLLLKNFYLENYQTKYPENHNYDLENFLVEKKANGYKIVTLLGSHDVPLFPREDDLSQRLSPIFSSTFDAAFHFNQILNEINDTILIIKPHPNDLFDYSSLESENVIVTKNFYNKRLFEISDVLIAGNTTLQFEAIFYEKPIILYGKSSLKHSKGVYLLENIDEIETVLKSALNKENLNEKIHNLQSAVQNILESYIYFYVNNSFKNLNHFIEFVEQNILNDVDDKQLFNRLEEFEFLILQNKLISNFKETHLKSVLIYYPENSVIYNEIKKNKQAIIKKLNEFYFKNEYSIYHKLLLIAEELINDEKYNEAEQILLKLCKNSEIKFDALNDLSYIEIKRGNNQQALEHIVNILKINPTEEIAKNNLAYLIENNLIDIEEIKYKLRKELFPKLILHKISSYNEYLLYSDKIKDEHIERSNFEHSLLPNDENTFSYKGICIVCLNYIDFIVDYDNSYKIENRRIPNWRERLVCPNCNLNNRLRLTFHLISELYPNFINSSVYITEQTTPFFKYLKNINPELVGSEYLGNKFVYGETNSDGIRNEDLTNLSFNDEQFDFIISLEVLEHIPDYLKALKECFRVLKKNGKILLTFPFNKNSVKNIVRARLNNDGTIQHLFPPEYHGDPINNNEGCLCYYHFGWEILDDIKKTGFEKSYAIFTYSKEYGYLGGDQIFFFAEKGA